MNFGKKMAYHSLQRKAIMLVVEHMKCILETLHYHFSQDRVFNLFKSHIVSNLEMPGRHTISNTIVFIGNEDKDWSKDYRLFSKNQWDASACMDVVFLEALKELPKDIPFIPIAVDLTSLRKHGKKIPYTSYQVDPLSPPFQKGLMWGQRFLHASLLIPMHEYALPARSVPIRLEIAPFVKKPGKKATLEDWAAYKKEKKIRNANIQTMKMMRTLREVCNIYTTKRILMVADGGFCNQECFKSLPPNVDLLSRCRKDAKLCLQSTKKGSFYSSEKFTPNEVRIDSTIPFHDAKSFYGGDWRNIQYKEISGLYWQRGAQKRPLRLIVIKPMPYRKTGSGNDNYRDPCYLLTTDLISDAIDLIQAYFNRIEIEQSHRDMKNNLGLGQAQVWSKTSTERHPQMIMIAYSILLLSILRACGTHRSAEYLPPPKWYRGRLRPTIEDMKRKLRRELIDNSEWQKYFGIKTSWRDVTQKLVA